MSAQLFGVEIEVFVKVVLLLGVSLLRTELIKFLVQNRYESKPIIFSIHKKEYVSGFYPKEESELVDAGYEYIVDGWYAALRIVHFKSR